MKPIPQQASGEQLYPSEFFLHWSSKFIDFFLKSAIDLKSQGIHYIITQDSISDNKLQITLSFLKFWVKKYNRRLEVAKRHEQKLIKQAGRHFFIYDSRNTIYNAVLEKVES